MKVRLTGVDSIQGEQQQRHHWQHHRATMFSMEVFCAVVRETGEVAPAGEEEKEEVHRTLMNLQTSST